jgi:hypothetical protein
MRAFYTQLTLILGGLSLLAACSEEPPPRSVGEFIDKPLMLEAAMVRCLQNRTETRYDAECVNARQAAQQIEAKEDEARSAELEARSESKRLALRRTQQAAMQARRRATENARLREEAEYLAQFGVAMPGEGVTQEPGEGVTQEDGQENGNTTLTLVPAGSEQRQGPVGDIQPENDGMASDGGNAPMSTTAPDEDEPQTN